MSSFLTFQSFNASHSLAKRWMNQPRVIALLAAVNVGLCESRSNSFTTVYSLLSTRVWRQSANNGTHCERHTTPSQNFNCIFASCQPPALHLVSTLALHDSETSFHTCLDLMCLGLKQIPENIRGVGLDSRSTFL